MSPMHRPSPGSLRSSLLRAARRRDHLERLGSRLHTWLAIHTLIGVGTVIGLACYFARGQCCR